MAIVRAGIAAVDAGRLVEQALLASAPRGALVVIAAGKAAEPMAAAAHKVLGGSIRAALAVTPVAAVLPPPFESITGSHPVPTVDSERAGRRALELASSAGQDETLLVLLSGGASALLAVPADGLTLDDKRETTRRLLLEGADIHALNTVRKHLSAIKGGWLAASTRAACRTLAVSDVVGDDPSVIASGPTVGDASTFADALAILQRFGGLDAYPPRVAARVQAGVRGECPETPKPGDARLARSETRVVAGRRQAMDAAAEAGQARGYRVVTLPEPVVGEARVAAQAHLTRAVGRVESGSRHCVVSSGETTVRVTGGGRGGRNQEFALAAAPLLTTMSGAAVLASVGTDGIDGPTDAAGAVADSTTCDRAHARGLGEPESYLADNNAYAFFDAIGDLITTGPTGTNVGDLQVLLVDPPFGGRG